VRTLRILVAEDNEDDFFFLERVLKKAGVASIYHVRDGRQAVEYLRGQGAYADRKAHPFPDILLLDLKLPHLTGHEVLEWLRKDRRFPTLKVFALSSSSDELDLLRARDKDIAGFFVKPVSLGHVAALLSRD
jgi:CheY-like chemotaxis protein